MAKTEARRARCNYHEALAAIVLMKGVAMIDVARDDALISALMEMDRSCVQRIAGLYDAKALGYPTAEKVTAFAVTCGLAPGRREHAPDRQPTLCIPVYTLGGRLVGVVWGVITGAAAAAAVGLMATAPWVHQVSAWLAALAARVGAFLYGT